MEKSNKVDMIPISLEDLDFNCPAPCNYFVKLSENKFILIVKSGQPLQRDQINKFKNRSLQYLWIKKSDQNTKPHKFAVGGVSLDLDFNDAEKASEILHKKTAEVFATIGADGGIKKASFESAVEITQAVTSLMEHQPSLQKILMSFNEQEDFIAKQAMAVSALSVLVATTLGWNDKLSLEKIALSGILHDIGLKAIPEDIVKKPLFLLADEELVWYKSHAFKSMEMLSRLGIVPADVIATVYQHHERVNGNGYPQKLGAKDIHPFAKVVGLVDDFIDLTVANPNNPEPKTPLDAIVHLESVKGRPYSKETFEALLSVIELSKKQLAS